MAEKHKSKYKAPKDLEKSQKPKARKDLKDYTTDDKKGKMNPKSNEDTIPNLLRKTDKPFVDDGTYDVKWNADDRLYDDLENGDYDPKKALKKLKKREDKEEKEVTKDKKANLTKESLRDRIKKLTVEQKEALIKEYIRRKVRTAFLNEQDKPADTEVAEPETIEPAEVPTPGSVTEPAAAAPAPAPATTPEPTKTPAVEPESPESIETEKQAKETVAVSKYVDSLKAEEGTFNKVTSIGNVIQLAITDLDVKDQARFFIELRKMATKNLVGLQADLSKTN